MLCVKPVVYKKFDCYKSRFSKSGKNCLSFLWIVGMLLISSLAVLLMILNVSSYVSIIPKPNKTLSVYNNFSKITPMHFVQTEVRPLKLTKHKIMNMPQMKTPPSQHETLQLLERLEVQHNYYNSRNSKAKLPIWHLARLHDNQLERFPTDRASFSSQIPRPPRLTRTLNENRRRYTETVSEQPRPFNFPLEGPQPSEFKKTLNSKKENPNKGKRVNNIQDILRQEQIAKVNQFRMPVGIHISGSFKNLQNSGVSNVFRKYVQLQPQMSPSQLNYQSVAFDPFYPYKPKSLNEINSMAMKQLGFNRTKKKKNKNTPLPHIIFQQSGHRPISTDMFVDALRMNNSVNYFGSQSQQNLKNEPFSLKLEVYPIRSGKKTAVLPMAEAQFLTTIRPSPSQNMEPFYPQIAVPYAMPIDNGANYFNYLKGAKRYQGRLPHLKNIYSGANQRHNLPLELRGLATHQVEAKKTNDKISKINSNQLMVHLNVFPSKKENIPIVPQNHLYDIIHADIHERSSAVKNETSKGTYADCETNDEVDPLEFYNYQHSVNEKDSQSAEQNLAEIVAKSPIEIKLNDTMMSDIRSSDNPKDKLATFRFPVENLMQFQANDAVN